MKLGALGALAVPGRLALVGLVLLFATVSTPAAARQDSEAAARLFADAQRLAQEGDVEASLRNYELLVQQFPQAAIADDALLLAARGRWELGDRPAAETAIAVLKERYARTAGAAGAFVLEGNIRMTTAVGASDLEAAREAFRSVVLLYGRSAFPELEWRAEALVKAGEASLLLGEPGEAAAHFLAAVEDELPTPWTQPARLHLAVVLMRSGQWAPAAEILQRIVDEGPPVGEEQGAAAAIVSTARRRLELGYRLMLQPSLSRLPWEGSRQVRITGPEIKGPEGVAASDDNRVIIVDPEIPLAAVLETDGSLAYRARPEEAFRPWWGRDGAPYVATKLSVLNLESRGSQDFFVPVDDETKQVEEITAGVHGAFDQWLLLDGDRKHVSVHDRAAEFASLLVNDEETEPVDVAVDHRGRIHVLDRKSETVIRFAADGSQPTRVVQREWRRPVAIAIDGLDNIYVLDRDAKTIDVFDPEGQFRWQLGPELPGGLELRSPRDLAVDGSGRIYVADRDLKAFVVIE